MRADHLGVFAVYTGRTTAYSSLFTTVGRVIITAFGLLYCSDQKLAGVSAILWLHMGAIHYHHRH